MYRNCMFCSARLGANDAVERFPVGRTLAFDGGKGRLWAVCGRCARWNLAPLEERWEAIEDAERLFRDAGMRAQSENIGIARLRDGTRLIRVGQALPGELAAWRYGEQIQNRHRRAMLIGGAATAIGIGVATAGVAWGAVGAWGAFSGYNVYKMLLERSRGLRTVGIVDSKVAGQPVRQRLRRKHLADAWTNVPEDGLGVALHLPFAIEELDPSGRGSIDDRIRRRPMVFRGQEASSLMARAMVHVNAAGAPGYAVEDAARLLQESGSAEECVLRIARQRLLLNGGRPGNPSSFRDAREWNLTTSTSDPSVSLALEMALHEQAERRALEENWRRWRPCGARPSRSPTSPTACRTCRGPSRRGCLRDRIV